MTFRMTRSWRCARRGSVERRTRQFRAARLALYEAALDHCPTHRNVEPGRDSTCHAYEDISRLQREADGDGQERAQHPDQLQLCLKAGKGAPQQCRRHVALGDRVEGRFGGGGCKADREREQRLRPQ